MIMKMKVESVPIGRLKPDEKNTRRHSQRNLDAIKASLEKFGQQKPLIVDADMRVVAGNGTLAAALELDWKRLLVVVSRLKKADLRAYAVADNRSAELAGWNLELLASTVKELGKSEEALAAMGFQPGELEKLQKKAEKRLVSFEAKDKDDEPEEVRCPRCGNSFVPSDDD